MAPYKRDIIKIYAVVGMGCLLLTVCLYWFGFKPLVDRLHSEHTNEINHLLASGYSLLQSEITRHADLARQSASRTAIRNKQVAYLNGKISRSKFISFSAPKLADAMNANKEIAGIQRHGPDGEILFTVGLPPPAEAVSACDLASLREIRILAPVKVSGAYRMLYCSPIIDQAAGYIGSDILIFDDDHIKKIVDITQKGLGNFAIVSQKRIIYWPQNLQDSDARSALEECLEYGCARQYDTSHAYILDSWHLKEVDWRLFVVVNKSDFFSDINRQGLILASVISLVLILVFVLIVLTLRPVIRGMLREKELFEESHRDGLTHLYDHAYMQVLLEQEIERSQRYSRLFSVVMFDLDHFKDVNDTYGHQAGDAVLKSVSEVVMATVRESDLAARYGGDEFLVILPETDSKGALMLAERLRSNVLQTIVFTTLGEISVTISLGVLTCDGCVDRYNKQQIIETVDKAMYTSKNNGRDQVTVVSLSKDNEGQHLV
jgi:diguanylate cyclase (GGDEF)-like protein